MGTLVFPLPLSPGLLGCLFYLSGFGRQADVSGCSRGKGTEPRVRPPGPTTALTSCFRHCRTWRPRELPDPSLFSRSRSWRTTRSAPYLHPYPPPHEGEEATRIPGADAQRPGRVLGATLPNPGNGSRFWGYEGSCPAPPGELEERVGHRRPGGAWRAPGPGGAATPPPARRPPGVPPPPHVAASVPAPARKRRGFLRLGPGI